MRYINPGKRRDFPFTFIRPATLGSLIDELCECATDSEINVDAITKIIDRMDELLTDTRCMDGPEATMLERLFHNLEIEEMVRMIRVVYNDPSESGKRTAIKWLIHRIRVGIGETRDYEYSTCTSTVSQS